MKIGLIYHQFLHAGGLENYLIEFSRRLAAAGHELHIVTSRIVPEVQAKFPATWHRLPRAPSPILRLWHFDRVAGRAAAQLPVDVTIGFGRTSTHDFHRAGGGCHAIYSRLLPWWKRYEPKNLLELALERKLYNGGGTKHFIMNSARVVAQIQNHYQGARDNCSVIYTAVDNQVYKPATRRDSHRELMCRQMHTDASKPIGLFVSLSHRRKGLDTLLQAWQGVDATLWIAGRPLNAHYQSLIGRLGLTSKVRALPPTGDLTALYQAADWFVHPTHYDACANTVLQSMACGLPGIISVQDGAVDHVQDGENGYMLYHPDSADELRRRLHQAFGTSEEQRQAMGTLARETMLPHTWDAHVADWMQLLNA